MSEIKEIIVFSEQGDPRKIKTWSNVPYFLTTTLESTNILVHTIDLSPQDIFQKVIRKLYDFIVVSFLKNHLFSYSRSYLYLYLSKQKIKKAINKYPNANLFVFTTFSQSASGISNKPSVLFCDWTIDHHITYFFDRKPNFFERRAIKRQNLVIENADAVFVLFPSVAQTMKKHFSNPNIFYNGNVINSLFKSDRSDIKHKISRNSLLFIGSKKYLAGIRNLISAYQKLKTKYTDLELHIVGVDQSDFPTIVGGIQFHGYLDKAKPNDALKYYELLKGAKIFINTTPKWAAFSASLEAMYFYTPLIITSYNEFVQTFGDKISFGSYYNSASDELVDLIDKILIDKKYEQLCLNANLAAKTMTWDSFINNFLNTIEAILKTNR